MPNDEPEQQAQKTWGGRFSASASALMTRINASITFDKRLWREDIAGSKAHAAMLRDQGIISAEDAEAILAGLDRISEEFERDTTNLANHVEAVFAAIQRHFGVMVAYLGVARDRGLRHVGWVRDDQVHGATQLGGCELARQKFAEVSVNEFDAAVAVARNVFGSPGMRILALFHRPHTCGWHLVSER